MCSKWEGKSHRLESHNFSLFHIWVRADNLSAALGDGVSVEWLLDKKKKALIEKI